MKNGLQKHKDNLSRVERIALWVTAHIGSIEFFIFCNIMVACILIVPKTITVIQFISSAWLQLVLLPLIMIGQNIQTRQADVIAESHYKNMVALEEKIISLIKENNE